MPAPVWAVELLRSEPTHRQNPLAQQRIWHAISRRSSHRVRPAWRAALALGTLVITLGATAVSSAALGHWPGWAVRAYYERLVARPSSPQTISTASAGFATTNHARHRALPTLPHEQIGPIGDAVGAAPFRDDDAPALRPITPTVKARLRLHRPARPEAISEAVAPESIAPASVPADETRPVVAAMRALRRDHDPVRARTLLRGYLRDHPRGALTEEALAISIEAALAHHDTDAATLGQRYLSLYPRGPFRALANQAAVGESPPIR